MNVNKKIVLILFILISLLCTNVYAISEFNTEKNTHYYSEKINDNVLLIEDSENIIDMSNIKPLVSKMRDLATYGNIIFRSSYVDNNTLEEYAKDYYNNRFGDTDGSILLIDTNSKNIYIYSSGRNSKVISEKESQSIIDNAYKYSKYGDYYSCVIDSFTQMNNLLYNGKSYVLLMITSGLIVSFIISCFICYIKVMFSSTNYDVSEGDILNNCEKKYDIKNVISYKTGEKKEYSPVDYDY